MGMIPIRQTVPAEAGTPPRKGHGKGWWQRCILEGIGNWSQAVAWEKDTVRLWFSFGNVWQMISYWTGSFCGFYFWWLSGRAREDPDISQIVTYSKFVARSLDLKLVKLVRLSGPTGHLLMKMGQRADSISALVASSPHPQHFLKTSPSLKSPP